MLINIWIFTNRPISVQFLFNGSNLTFSAFENCAQQSVYPVW